MVGTCGWDLTERALLAKLFEGREGKLDSKIGRLVDFLSIAAWYSRSHVPVDGSNSRSAKLTILLAAEVDSGGHSSESPFACRRLFPVSPGEHA